MQTLHPNEFFHNVMTPIIMCIVKNPLNVQQKSKVVIMVSLYIFLNAIKRIIFRTLNQTFTDLHKDTHWEYKNVPTLLKLRLI